MEPTTGGQAASPSEERQAVAPESVAGPPVMYQQWRDLLFLHWETDPARIQGTLPPGLSVDTCRGRAYLGIVPFRMQRVRPRFFPPVPGLSAFPELNLRTYVVDGRGLPGVWFYSLDAGHWLAVRIARSFFHLPYHRARMSWKRDDTGHTCFLAERGKHPSQEFRYKSDGPAREAESGSLEAFLVERYLLYAYNPRRKRLYRGRVRHAPYRVAAARVAAHSRGLFTLNGFADPQRPPDHQLVSEGVDVTIEPLRPA